MRRASRRLPVSILTAMLAGCLVITCSPAAVGQPRTAQAPILMADDPEITQEQREFILDFMGPQALAEIEQTLTQADGRTRAAAFPIAPALLAAAAWCARGAVSSVPTTTLSNIAKGKPVSGDNYARNAIIGCLGGEIGGWAWRVLPGWVKDKAVALVAAFIIRFMR